MIITATPAGLEHYFAAVGSRLEGRDQDPIPPSAEDIARLIRMAPDFGLELLDGH